jgi:hypothetical protein
LVNNIQDERYPKPTCQDSSPVNKENHMKIEINSLKCCHIPVEEVFSKAELQSAARCYS